MKIFLTGGTGFIGSHFLNLLSRQDHKVTALRRAESKPCIKIEKEPEWLVKEMDDLDVSDLEGCDTLVHLASIGVSPQVATWKELLYWNVTVLINLLEISHLAGVRRIVITGSCAEYGKSSELYDFIPTDAPLKPTFPYAASKAASYVLANAFALENKLELCYLRIFSAFGEGQFKDNFWPALREAALHGKDFSMSPGEQVRDYIPVEDVVEDILFACEREDITREQPSLSNVGSGNPVTMRKFAEKWWKQLNATGNLKIGELPYREYESMRVVPQLDDSQNKHIARSDLENL
jgi:nucleoside-diphosphate-sugar epimerase